MAERKPLFMQTEGFAEEMATSDTATFGGLTLSGNIVMAGNKITGLGDPTSAQDAATKFYVDAVATGLDLKASVRLATAAALPAYTAAGTGVGKTLTANANGALSVDSVAVAAGNRVLVKDQATSDADHGIYTVTVAGSAGTAFVLTRATDADQNAEVTAGMFTFVEEGTVNADTGWVLVTNNPITVDTTALQYSQFSSSTAVTYGAGLLKTGSVIDVELDTGANAQGAGSGGGSSGLEFDTSGAAGKLRAAVNATGGLSRTGSGLAALLADSTITTGASGLTVDHAPVLQSPIAVAEAIAVGDAVYQSTTSAQVGKARADTNAKANVLGVAKTAQSTVGQTADIVSHGPVTGVISGATPGDQYYLQATGGIGTSVPGASNRVISVGFAMTATKLFTRITDYGKRAA